MTADGSIIIDTKIDRSGLEKGLKGLGGFAVKGLSAVGVAVAAVGTGLIAAGKYAIEVGSSFDTAMSQVAATMGTTVDQIQGLSDVAQKMGATTQFTATQAAEALNYLAQAGYDAESQAAALPQVLNLAAAGAMNLGSAADLVANSMNVLGLGTEDLTLFSNQLAITAATASGDVSDFGQAILVCGGQAKLANMDLVDMNTALGILADNGIKGAEGGTALRNALKNLYTPTAQSAEALKSLGVSSSNADGTLRNTQEVLRDLSAALDGLSENDRINAMNAIFDTRTIAAANALLANSGERWDELSEKIGEATNQSTQAADMAATQLDNLEGDVTLFKSALEGVGNAAYKNLRDPLREIVQLGTGWMGQLADAVNDGGLAGLVGVMGDILAQIIQKVTEFAPTLLEAASTIIQSFLSGIAENKDAIAGALTELVTGAVTAIFEIVPLLLDAGIQLASALLDGLGQQLPAILPAIVQGIIDLAYAIVDNIPLMVEAAISLVTGLVDGLIAAIPVLVAAVPELISSFLNALWGSEVEIVQAGVELLSSLVKALPEIIAAIVAVIPQIIDGIVSAFTQNFPLIIRAGIDLLVSLIQALPEIITTICTCGPQIIAAIVEALTGNIDQIIQCGVELFVALIQNLPAIIVGIVEAIPQIITGIIQGFEGFFGKLAECGKNLFNAIFKRDGDKQAIEDEFVSSSGAAVADAAEGMNAEAEKVKLADKIKPKLEEATTAVSEWGTGVAESAKTAFNDTVTAVSEWGTNLADSVKEGLPQFIESAKEWLAKLPEEMAFQLGVAIGHIAQFGIDLYNWATTEIPAAINAVIEWFAALPGQIWDWLTEAATNVAEWGVELYNKAVETGTDFIEGIIEFVQTLPERVNEWLTSTIEAVSTWASNLVTKAVQTATQFVTSIVNYVKELPGKIKEQLTQAWNNVVAWASDLINTARQKIPEFARQCVDAIASLPGEFLSIGSQLVSGLWNGISAGWSWLTSQVKSLANSLVRGVKSVLKISSPSKVFEWIGQMTGAGMALGIEDSENDVERAYAALLNRIAGSAIDIGTVNAGLRNTAADTHRAAAFAATSDAMRALCGNDDHSQSSTYGDINITVEAQISGEQDIDALARKLANKLGRDVDRQARLRGVLSK